MICNTTLLPDVIWTVTLPNQKDTSWTTRQEARARKRFLNDNGIMSVKIHKTSVIYTTTVDSHS